MRTQIHETPLSGVDIAPFFASYESFIKKKVLPGFVGQEYITYSIELVSGSYRIMAEHNKKFNDGSFSRICTLTEGFVSGYIEGAKT